MMGTLNDGLAILREVREDARILTDDDGNEIPASIEVEVEFEAAERGYENSTEMAREVVEYLSR